jgi:hypothetical protein
MISLSPGMRFLSQDWGEAQSPDPVEVSVDCATATNVNIYVKKTVNPNFMQYLLYERRLLFNRIVGEMKYKSGMVNDALTDQNG